MTDAQRAAIAEYRAQGYGYKKISQITGVCESTVKTFCRRNSLTDYRGESYQSHETCPLCGGEIVQIPGRKPRRFCSASCRQSWWNAHLTQVKHRDVRSVSCAHCGSEFHIFGRSEQKYCSHECYIAARFHTGDAV